MITLALFKCPLGELEDARRQAHQAWLWSDVPGEHHAWDLFLFCNRVHEARYLLSA